MAFEILLLVGFATTATLATAWAAGLSPTPAIATVLAAAHRRADQARDVDAGDALHDRRRLGDGDGDVLPQVGASGQWLVASA